MVIKDFSKIQDVISEDIALTIVNDCSTTDITADIALLQDNIPQLKVIHLKENRGKGYALRQGVEASEGTYYIYTDIDFPYQHTSFLAIYSALKEGHDVVAGIKNKAYYDHTPPMRKWISQLLRFFIKNLLRLKVSDTQCGLKGFNNKGKRHFLSTTIDRYLFDLEFIHSASKDPNISMQAIEVTLKPDIIFRKMNLKIISQEIKNFSKILFKR